MKCKHDWDLIADYYERRHVGRGKMYPRKRIRIHWCIDCGAIRKVHCKFPDFPEKVRLPQRNDSNRG